MGGGTQLPPPGGEGTSDCTRPELAGARSEVHQHPDVITAALEGHEEFYEGCMVEPFPESFDASVSAWQWPGAYPYAAADSAYSNFLACLKALYIGTCQQRGLDTFHCNA